MVRNLTPSFIEIIPARDKIQAPINNDSFDLSQLFGGWLASRSEFRKGSLNIKANEEQILAGSATAPLTGIGLFFGKDGSDYEFRAGDPANNKYLHYDGTNLALKGGTITASSMEIGTDAWHVDTNGNMWWGSAATYALATVKISTAGEFLGATVTGTFQTAASGARITIESAAPSEINIYASGGQQGSIALVSTNETRLAMNTAGGFVTLQAKNDAGTLTEVLRADGDGGVTIPASLALTAFNIVINKTGTGATMPLEINNSGSGISFDISQSYTSNASTAFNVVNDGSGAGFSIVSTSTSNNTYIGYFKGKGTGNIVQMIAQSNASNTQAVLYIENVGNQGAHIHVEPNASAPQTPTAGDIYSSTDTHLYYYNGSAWKQLDN